MRYTLLVHHNTGHWSGLLRRSALLSAMIGSCICGTASFSQESPDAEGEKHEAQASEELAPGKDIAKRRWLGIAGKPIDDFYRAELEVPENAGFGVLEVAPNSPAAKAGIQRLDVILSINDRPVKLPEDVAKILAESDEKPVHVTLRRKGGEVKLEVVPEYSPEKLGDWEAKQDKASRERNKNEKVLDREDFKQRQKRLEAALKAVEEAGQKQIEQAEQALQKQLQALEQSAVDVERKSRIKEKEEHNDGAIEKLRARQRQLQDEHRTLIEQFRGAPGRGLRVRKFGPGKIKGEEGADKPAEIEKEELGEADASPSDGSEREFYDEQHHQEHEEHSANDGGLPKRLKIEFLQNDDEPARLHVETDEGKWDVSSDDLDDLPESLRDRVRGMLKLSPQAIVLDPQNESWTELLDLGIKLAPSAENLDEIEGMIDERLDAAQEAIQERVETAVDGLHEQMESVFAQVHEQLDQLKEGIEEIRGEAEEKVNEALETARESAGQAAVAAKEEINKVREEMQAQKEAAEQSSEHEHEEHQHENHEHADEKHEDHEHEEHAEGGEDKDADEDAHGEEESAE